MKPILLILMLSLAPASAHEGHDHGAAPAPTGINAERLADGSVFVPKPMQRELAIRTLVARKADHPRTVELAGRVIADPNAGGRVQATQSGRIEPGPRGLPALGQRVARGEVLAYVRAAQPALERAGAEAQSAELAANIAIAERRVARLEALEGSVPQKEIDAARMELRGLRDRRAAIGSGLGAREALVAPVAGVVSVAAAIAGQVVDAREVLFEIVDPSRLLVEALAYDPALANDIAGANLALGRDSAPLTFVGAGRQLRDQALPLVFRANALRAALAVGQPVKVVVQTRGALAGVLLPVDSIVRGASNENVVWVHDHAELFVPRRVRAEALDGARVVVREGIAPGERVVTRGAGLIAQIR